jgi:hypothetical protein
MEQVTKGQESNKNFWHHFAFHTIEIKKIMESRKENCGEKRRRKVVSRPVLVRSEKPGQVMSASYGRQGAMPSLWRAA